MSKKKLLFVDDEPNILEGLKRMLRSLRNEYDMYFALSGREALALMAENRIDVVISDMRMPGMDGAQLLELIQKDHPHTIRIMLTGHAEESAVTRTVGVVHQFLAKPCDPARLKSILVQTSALQDLLSDGRLKDLISQIGKLPSLPANYMKLRKVMSGRSVDINEVAAIIEQDIAMSAKVLQLVNSSFFGIYQKVDSPGRAVRLLGLETINVLVLGIEIFSQIAVPNDIYHIDTLWRHGLCVGKVARQIMATVTDEKEMISDSFLAGMLHDIGKLVLISYCPDMYRNAIQMAKERSIRLSDAEQEVFGARQSIVGAYLLGLWGFSSPVIEAVGFLPHLQLCPSTSMSPMLAVHIANVLYYKNRPEELIGAAPELDMPCIERFNLIDKLPAWNDLCSEILASEVKEQEAAE